MITALRSKECGRAKEAWLELASSGGSDFLLFALA